MRLTRQEWRVLVAVLLLLAVGWGVKRWRLGREGTEPGVGVGVERK